MEGQEALTVSVPGRGVAHHVLAAVAAGAAVRAGGGRHVVEVLLGRGLQLQAVLLRGLRRLLLHLLLAHSVQIRHVHVNWLRDN